MDDFEKAILFSFDQSGAVGAELRAQAQAYCEQAKQSRDIWRLCLERLAISRFSEVQFWCLQVLDAVVRDHHASFEAGERNLLCNGLLSVVCSMEPVADDGGLEPNGVPEVEQQRAWPSFLRNKLAQVIVRLIRSYYPAEWPSAFLDLLGLLERGPAVVDMFSRIMATLDEELISLDYARSAEDNAVATRVKDSMRQQCVPQIVESWYSLVLAYKDVNPQLAAAVLESMQPYITWIDMGLVANERWMPLLFSILSMRGTPPSISAAASDCLLAVVSKRMDATAKLGLLQRLQINQLCQQLTKIEDTELVGKVSALCRGLATEIIESKRQLESGSSAQPAEMEAADNTLTNMLNAVLPCVFYFVENGDEDISAATFQFLLTYVSSLRKPKQLSYKQQEHLSQILSVVRAKMRYDAGNSEELDEPDRTGMELEANMAEYRKDLFNLLRSICRLAPETTKAFVKSTFVAATASPDTPFEDVEAALVLVYQLGEGVTEEALKPGSGAMANFAAALLDASIPCHTHRLVALGYLETIVRYVRYVQQESTYIPLVLSAFLGDKGIHHPNVNVSSRASYLFMRTVKALRVQLIPYIETILQSLQDVLATIMTTQAKHVSPSTKADSIMDKRLYTYEAVGLLMGLEELSSEKQATYLSAILVPLCRQVDITLATVTVEDLVGPPEVVWALQQVISAISHLSKGFGERLTTDSRPELGALFKQSLDMVLRVLQTFPKSKILRSKIISFLHRMVETLGCSILPLLPSAIEQLLLECEAKDMVEFIQFVNQLMNRFKVGVTSILDAILRPTIARVFFLLPPAGLQEGPGSITEEQRELKELQRIYFTFLNTITMNSLSSVFVSLQNGQVLNQVINTLVEASSSHHDVLVRKVCIQTLAKLIAEWCGDVSEPEKVPGFRRFVIETIAGQCCIYPLLQGNFDLKDANTVSLFGEMALAQKALYEKCGQEFLLHMATVVLPAVHCPPDMAEQYCLHLQSLPKLTIRSTDKAHKVAEIRCQGLEGLPEAGLGAAKATSEWQCIIQIAVDYRAFPKGMTMGTEALLPERRSRRRTSLVTGQSKVLAEQVDG
eukprot:SM000115S23930  [mRNA]  locus=s115:316090:322671:+ [translate_table: standard]